MSAHNLELLGALKLLRWLATGNLVVNDEAYMIRDRDGAPVPLKISETLERFRESLEVKP